MLGAYWQDQEIDFNTNFIRANGTPFSPSGASPTHYFEEATYSSVFAAISWDPAEDWRIDLGIRYTNVEKDALLEDLSADVLDAEGARIVVAGPSRAPDGTQVFGVSASFADASYQCLGTSPVPGVSCIDPLTLDDDDVSYQAALTYRVGEDHRIFVRYADGFKAGGFSRLPAAFIADTRGIYKPEEAASLELGGRFNLFDNKLRLGAVAYQTEYTNQQVLSGVVTENEITLFIFINAAESTIRGVELDATYHADNGFSISGTLATMNGEFDSFPNALCNSVELADAAATAMGPGPRTGLTGPLGCTLLNAPGTDGVIDLSGVEFEGQPDWKATLRVGYNLDFSNNWGMRLSADASFFDDFDDTRPGQIAFRAQDGFSVVNVRASLRSPNGDWDVAAYGRNITDELYWLSQPQDLSIVGTARANISRPKNWGLQLRYNFGD
jgi:iron complex outermembrane receptor protein